jgi:hypothetical protein
MDERAGPILLLTPILIVIVAYFLAWRSKSAGLRKGGNLVVAAILGLVALFGSWWGLGMTIGIWALDGSGAGPHTTSEVLLALVAEIFVFLFPLGAWSLCVRFAKTSLKKL